jgi:hypothetical protein
MPRKKKSSKPRAPVIGRREAELLALLERIKRSKKRITVAGFAREARYANKSALRHFPVLRRELNLYIAQFSKSPQRQDPSLAKKYFETQIERQGRTIDRLKRQTKVIPELKATIAMLRRRVKEDENQKKQLRGMLSTVIAFLSSSDFAKARDLSDRVEAQVSELLDDSGHDET